MSLEAMVEGHKDGSSQLCQRTSGLPSGQHQSEHRNVTKVCVFHVFSG